MRRLVAIAGLAVLLSVSAADARPGGGGSYKSSSGGGSYKSSSGGGGSYKSSSGGGGSYKSSSGGGSYKSSSGGGSYKSSSGGGGSYGGGGGSYGGGGGSYGGGGGGGGSGGSGWTVGPSEPHPWVPWIFFLGLPLLCFGLVLYYRRSDQDADFESAYAEPKPARTLPKPRPELRRRLEVLRAEDPDFSVVVFEDFLYALFSATHEARASNALERLRPWLADDVCGQLGSRSMHLSSIRAVVVGAMHYHRLSCDADRVKVSVTFEANYEEVQKDDDYVEHAQAYYVGETWTLVRKRTARSRPPVAVRSWDCPACGAGLGGMRERTCAHCGRTLEQGEFDWTVTDVQELTRETRTPMLVGTTEEQGNDLPTIVDPQAMEAFAALRAKDPAFSWEQFCARVRLVFGALQETWSTRNALGMRPYLTDNLWQVQRYWIDTYRRAGLVNVTKDGEIHEIEGARVTTDRWFDAITIRLRASSYDWTERDVHREIVGGSDTTRRVYTEYWTFVRGAATTGPATTEKLCPKCGASLSIDQAGDCTYCEAHVTSGDFDWVLSRIEQDDSYGG